MATLVAGPRAGSAGGGGNAAGRARDDSQVHSAREGAPKSYDAVVVGSGPNGLAAAVTLARVGRRVLVLEGKETIGGGCRSAELTAPGFVHDVCAAIHPLGVASPFFRQLPLADHGLAWLHPPAPLAHPFDDGTAVLLERSVAATAAGLGEDQAAYVGLLAPFVAQADGLLAYLLAPWQLPRRPLLVARFGMCGLLAAEDLAHAVFRGDRARALLAGLAAHSMLPLAKPLTAAFALLLGIAAHAVGWPVVRGGSQRLAEALASYLRMLGGEVLAGREVRSLDELPAAPLRLLDVTPKQLLALAGGRLPAWYARGLAKYRYGPGVCKVDYALDGPVPWRAAACRRAGTVHLGGTFAEIAAAEAAVWRGEHPQAPFVIVAQQSLCDPSRAPAGRHTLWAYSHVPSGSARDVGDRIEAQIERFAPGFRRRILARHILTAAALEQYNPNYVGGDINGGVLDARQLIARPVRQAVPYAIPLPGLYLCSCATPPGGGVHGMCGHLAARAALRAGP